MEGCVRLALVAGGDRRLDGHQIRLMPYETAPCERLWRGGFGRSERRLRVPPAHGNRCVVKDLRCPAPRKLNTVAQALPRSGACRGKRGALINPLRRCRKLRTAKSGVSSGEDLKCRC